MKTFIFRVPFIFFLTLFFSRNLSYSQRTYSEEDRFFVEINNDVNRLIDKHISVIDHRPARVFSPGEFGEFLYTYPLSDSVDRIRDLITDAERKRIGKDIGLRYSVGYINNFSNGFNELGFFYRSAFHTGVDWNLLQNGLVESRLKSREYYYQQRLNTFLRNSTVSPAEYSYIYNKIVEAFARAKKEELSRRKTFIDEHLSVSKKLYYKKLLLWDDILKLLSQQEEVQNLLQQYTAIPTAFDSSSMSLIESIPVLKINEEKLFARFTQVRNQDSLRRLHQEYLRYKYKAVRDFGLRPFVRYNYYDYQGINISNRDFVSTGIQFSVPLPLRSRQNGELRELQNKEFYYKSNEDLTVALNELRNLCFEYQEKYNTYVSFHYKKLIIKEKIRREQTKQTFDDPDYSPVFISRQLDELYQVNYELLNIKEDLCLILLRMKRNLPEISFPDFTSISNINQEAELMQSFHKTMYVWSTTFKSVSNEDLVKDLKNAGCGKVIVSINHTDSLKLKVYELNQLLLREKIELHLMVGNNNYIYPQHHQEFLEALNYLLEIPGIKGIHLDIEPHVIPALKSDRTGYLDMYVKMLEKAKEATDRKHVQLSVSIPLFYEKEKLEKIYGYCDKVYLMAYENTSQEFLQRKTAEELLISRSKTVVALRTKDFKDKNSLNQQMKILSSLLEVSDFAIHDLKTWKTLE